MILARHHAVSNISLSKLPENKIEQLTDILFKISYDYLPFRNELIETIFHRPSSILDSRWKSLLTDFRKRWTAKYQNGHEVFLLKYQQNSCLLADEFYAGRFFLGNFFALIARIPNALWFGAIRIFLLKHDLYGLLNYAFTVNDFYREEILPCRLILYTIEIPSLKLMVSAKMIEWILQGRGRQLSLIRNEELPCSDVLYYLYYYIRQFWLSLSGRRRRSFEKSLPVGLQELFRLD